MDFSMLLCLLTLISLFSLVLGCHGPGGQISLINQTPYDWKLTYSHSYSMDWKFPAVISAGTQHVQYIEYCDDNRDAAAEASYALVNSPIPRSFSVLGRQAKGKKPKSVKIQYQDKLSTLNNDIGSLLDLGFTHDGAIQFVLVGDGVNTPIISSNPPVGWMQATFEAIGDKTLREISMPASHNSGMSVFHYRTGLPHNTITQSLDIYEQLVNGVRWLDIRPIFTWTEQKGFYTSGLSISFVNDIMGALGMVLHEIVNHINRFTDDYPGELIILDITHDMNELIELHSFSPSMWLEFSEKVLQKIHDLWIPHPDLPFDLSVLPLSTFITPGSKSAVLTRVRTDATFREDEQQWVNRTKLDPAISKPGYKEAFTHFCQFYTSWENDGIYGFRATPEENEKDRNRFTGGKADSALPPSLFHAERLPITGSYPILTPYPRTESPAFIAGDQIRKLREFRVDPGSPVHRSSWIWTLSDRQAEDIGNMADSILGAAAGAHKELFTKLWPVLSYNVYPNIIEVDNVFNNQFLALTMAINAAFARG